MSEDRQVPQINASKLPVGGGIAGALFTALSMMIFLVGIPALQYFLPAAILLGIGVALVIRSVRHETPGAPWILAAASKDNAPAGAPIPRDNRPDSHASPRSMTHPQWRSLPALE